MVILVVLLVFVSFYRKYQEKQFAGSNFINSAIERGLTEREQQVLGEVAVKSGLKQRSSIFTMSKPHYINSMCNFVQNSSFQFIC